ncbi:MAG: GAF domain-containing protein [Deltaproteobacteria bacterium]|nr:GAF domain-containing protein [Deltaproteobacteria bacterium]
MSNVLVVDNDRFILEFMKDILSKEGHQVITAEDGLSAVDILEDYVPDIIFVDLIMPNIDGKRLCKIIRGMRKLEDVYLVIISATLSEDEADVEGLGIDACIAKGPLNEMAQEIFVAVDRSGAVPRSPMVRNIPAADDTGPKSITGELISIKKHFESIFEKMSEGILELADNGRIVYANPSALSIIGLQEEKLLASRFVDLFPEDSREAVAQLMEVSNGESKRIPEGDPVCLNDYLLTLKALPIDGNRPTAVIILNDVTKKKEAEKALRQRNRELELLNVASGSFNSSLDLDQVLVTVLEELRRLIEVEGSTIWLVDPENNKLVCRQAAGSCAKALNGWRLEPHQGLAGWVARHGEPLNVSDTRTDTRHYKGVDERTGVESRSILGTPLITKGKLIGVIQVVDTQPGRFDASHQRLLQWLAGAASTAIENARLYEYANREIEEREKAEKNLSSSVERLRKTLNGTIHSMALIVERRDPYTAGHQRRVAHLGQAIAEEMGLPKHQIEGIRMSGLIHDIGKMAIPAAILSKPGKLDPEEFALIMKHPWVGYDVLKQVEFPWPIAQIVYQHHEKMNGSGYPQGLSGEGILIEARILCASDVIEAMASHRPYRAALGIQEALKEIEAKKGELYDPQVVEICLTLFRKKAFSIE